MATTVTVKTKSHITSVSDLAVKLWTDLTTGTFFTSILPAGSTTPPTVTAGAVKFVLQSTALVNPLQTTQPYRIMVEVVNNERMKVSIADPVQISDLGVVSSYPGNTAFRASNKVGMLGTKWDDATAGTNDYPTDSQFLVKPTAVYPDGDLSGSPLSYLLSITDHGIAFNVWGNDFEAKPRSSWFVVQSPVDKATGAPRIDKNSPIFCVYSCNTTPDGISTASQISTWLAKELTQATAVNTSGLTGTQFNTWLQAQLVPPIGGTTSTGGAEPSQGWLSDTISVYKFVVSESDVFVASPSVRADVDRPDSSAIINTQQQVAIAPGNQYLVTIPNRLNTQRYAYTDELDLIGYTSSDVISQDSNVPVTVYGESGPRTYKAMKATGANNTGLRILVLIAVP